MQRFGGTWTEEKLEILRKYLCAYSKIMSKQSFRYAYIDAFAGTGYLKVKNENDPQRLLFEEETDPSSQQFLDGSARIALSIDPPFDRYILIEQDSHRVKELEKLRDDFSKRKDAIQIVSNDCNSYLQEFCAQHDWRNHRALVFLDPFGMNVSWKTIVRLAETRAVDLWYLFPLGIGVNRLLRNDAQIPAVWQSRLTNIFGDESWRKKFYVEDKQTDFFLNSTHRKATDFDGIRDYLLEKLRLEFPGVANNPLYLYNSVNNPLYLFCFACANERGAPIAIRIAQHILGS